MNLAQLMAETPHQSDQPEPAPTHQDPRRPSSRSTEPRSTESRASRLSAALINRIRAIESGVTGAQTLSALARLPTGLEAVDRLLGGGLPTGCVHEISGPADEGAALGFATVLLSHFSRSGPIIWITACRASLHAPGLAGLGLTTERLLIIEAKSRAMRLWALAEALRWRGISAALAELDAVDFNVSRRLQLAAAASQASALLLDTGPVMPRQASAARTRWRLAAAPSLSFELPLSGDAPRQVDKSSTQDRHEILRSGIGQPRWQLELLRGPAATTGAWLIEQTAEGLRHVAEHPTSRSSRSNYPSVAHATGHRANCNADAAALTLVSASIDGPPRARSA